jgi:alkaline phosphatase
MVRKRRVLKAMIVAVSATMLMVSSVGASGHHSYKKFKNSIDFKNYKNVIVLIPDGCDETVQTVARWYKGEDLQVDKMAGGGVKVHMANSVIPVRLQPPRPLPPATRPRSASWAWDRERTTC